jgi:predicted outer membrane repeat protein
LSFFEAHIRRGVCGAGGGIYAVGSQVLLEDVVFSQNAALHGGGAFFSGGGLTALRCAFNYNCAAAFGGALYAASVSVRPRSQNPQAPCFCTADAFANDRAAYRAAHTSAAADWQCCTAPLITACSIRRDALACPQLLPA